MSPAPRPMHSAYQGRIVALLYALAPSGIAGPDISIQTSDGERVPDAFWLPANRVDELKDTFTLRQAPPVCIEVLSPSNSEAEMRDKRRLFFEAGAEEFWLCNLDGAMTFYDASGQIDASKLVPAFPLQLDLLS